MGSELGTDRTIADKSGLIVNAERFGVPLSEARVGVGLSGGDSWCICCIMKLGGCCDCFSSMYD
jgi:hypothetical protein